MARRQLLALGATPSAIAHARRCGRLFDLYRGVYATLAPELLGEDGELIAALLAVGPGAVVSHGTAAWRLDLIPAPPVTIELSAPHEHVARPGLQVRRCTALRATDVTDHGRFRSTTPVRTLLDLAVDYDRFPLLRALEQAEFEHDVRPEHVLAVLRRGHPGSARLRAALDEHVPGYGAAKEGLERAFRSLLVEAGVELPARNVPIGRWTVDCLWNRLRIVVELDGRWHQRPHQRTVDSDRDLWLRRHGYLVLRYTWTQLRHRPAEVIADLRQEMARVVGGAGIEPATSRP